MTRRTAIRCTFTSATKSQVTSLARASPRSAPHGSRALPQVTMSPHLDRALAAVATN